MPGIKTKKPRSARSGPARKAGNSPAPCGPGSSCGHSGCGVSCQVRYVGPTSHPRDHHAQAAAHGVKQVWTAAIVAGLAVVLTGAIAYSAVEAQSPSSKGSDSNSVSRRLDKIEERLRDLSERCVVQPKSEDTGSQKTGKDATKSSQ